MRSQVVEPMIGRMKADGLLGRNCCAASSAMRCTRSSAAQGTTWRWCWVPAATWLAGHGCTSIAAVVHRSAAQAPSP